MLIEEIFPIGEHGWFIWLLYLFVWAFCPLDDIGALGFGNRGLCSLSVTSLFGRCCSGSLSNTFWQLCFIKRIQHAKKLGSTSKNLLNAANAGMGSSCIGTFAKKLVYSYETGGYCQWCQAHVVCFDVSWCVQCAVWTPVRMREHAGWS